MARHKKQRQAAAETEYLLQCPYCQENTPVVPAPDYAPIYATCTVCGRKFIVERVLKGFLILKAEGAPCCDDPDRRVVENSLGDED